jgi:site-specific DNA recombinase
MKKLKLERTTVGYCRVSTDEQATSGVSLDAQDARLRAYALATGRELAEVVIDAGESAKTLERPGMGRILAGIRSGEIGALVALKLDRLTRSVRDLADLLELFTKKDVALVLVSESIDTSTAIGRMICNLMASVSQWEREAIGERTAFALGHKRRNRQAYGHTPFGYRREGDRLVEDRTQQAALAEARRMSDSGAKLREIGAALTATGVQTPQGGAEWRPSSVRAILRSRISTEVP